MRKRFGLLFLTALLLAACGDAVRKADQRAVAGVLDLSAHNFAAVPLVNLGGEWEYYPGKLFFSPVEIKQAKSEYIMLPQTWSGNGHGTYRLKVRLPAPYSETYAIHMEAQLSAYEISINGVNRASSGKPGTSRAETIPATRPLTVGVPQSTDLEVLLSVANYHHRKGGVFKKIYLGTASGIAREIDMKRLLDTTLVGILATMALYHLVIFALRWRNRAALLFGLVCLMILSRSVTTGEKLLLVIWPVAPFEFYTMLEYLSYFWSIPFALHFFHELYPIYMAPWIHRAFYLVSLVFSAVVLITPLSIYSHTSYLYMPVMAAGMIIVAFLLGRVAWRREPNALTLAAGFLVLALTVLNDSLNTLEILRSGYMVHFGFLGIVLVYASVLAARFSRALDDSESSSRKLQVANETLETRVAERTIEILQEKNIAETANKQKDNFLALVSHDLRSPLSGLYSALQTVRLAPLEPEKKQKLLGLAEKSAFDLIQMIDGLLQLHRFKKGKKSDNNTLVHPRVVVDELAQTLRESLAEKKITLVNALPPAWQLKTDAPLLQHVLRNLLTNAIKYSHVGGGITVSLTGENPPAISVLDYGVGMDARQVAAISGEEQAVSTAGTAGERGSGLGLAICRQMLQSQGGDLVVTAQPGKGSTFVIRLAEK